MRTAHVLPYDTLGSFCQRHGISREDVFYANPQLLVRIMFTSEGVPTAFLEEGEELTLAGVGASGPKCTVNKGDGGWQKKDGRWYYAHHEGLILYQLANKYGTTVSAIWSGSKNAGTVPTSWQNSDNVPIFQNGERTLFWMPDGAIEMAYEKGCIPDKGELGGPKTLVATSKLTVPCNLDNGKGGWVLGEEGRWYFAHGQNILLGDLAEVYLGSVGAYKQIFEGSQDRGLLPPGSTPDNIPITWSDGRRTLFWMPDEGILTAHKKGCIPDPGNLSNKPPPISCSDGAKSTWNQALGKWECPPPCSGGRMRASDGLTCVCPEGTVGQNPSDPQSPCKPKGSGGCPAGSVLQPDGTCKDLSNPSKNPCPNGMKRNPQGECVMETCPPGQSLNELGQCVPKKETLYREEEEKSSLWPWILGGLAILGIGGAILYASSEPDNIPQDDFPQDDEPPLDELPQDDGEFGSPEDRRFGRLRVEGQRGRVGTLKHEGQDCGAWFWTWLRITNPRCRGILAWSTASLKPERQGVSAPSKKRPLDAQEFCQSRVFVIEV